MAGLLSLLLSLAGALGGAAGVLFAIIWLDQRVRGRPRHTTRSGAVDIQPPEPGWTETIGGDGELVFARGQSFHPELMRQDARGRRGEFTMRG